MPQSAVFVRVVQSRGREAEVFKVVNHVGRGGREKTEVAIFKWASTDFPVGSGMSRIN